MHSRWLLLSMALLVTTLGKAASSGKKDHRRASGNTVYPVKYECDVDGCSEELNAFAALVWHKHEKHPELSQSEANSAESAGSASVSADDLAVAGKKPAKGKTGAQQKTGGRKRKASESDEDYCG